MIKGTCPHCRQPVSIDKKAWRKEYGYTDERMMIWGPDEHWFNANCPHCGGIISTTIRDREHPIEKARVG